MKPGPKPGKPLVALEGLKATKTVLRDVSSTTNKQATLIINTNTNEKQRYI